MPKIFASAQRDAKKQSVRAMTPLPSWSKQIQRLGSALLLATALTQPMMAQTGPALRFATVDLAEWSEHASTPASPAAPAPSAETNKKPTAEEERRRKLDLASAEVAAAAKAKGINLVVDTAGTTRNNLPLILHAEPSLALTSPTRSEGPVKLVTIDVAALVNASELKDEMNVTLKERAAKIEVSRKQLTEEGNTLIAEYQLLAAKAKDPAISAEARAEAKAKAKGLAEVIRKKRAEAEQSVRDQQDSLRETRTRFLRGICQDAVAKAIKAGANVVLDRSAGTTERDRLVIYAARKYELEKSASSAGASEVKKVGIVNVRKVYEQDPRLAAQKQRVEQDRASAEAELERIKTERAALSAKRDELSAVANDTKRSPEERAKAQAATTELDNTLLRKDHERNNFETNTAISFRARERTFRELCIEDIVNAAAEIARKEKYDLVLDVSGETSTGAAAIVVADPSWDLTATVTKVMKKRAE